MMKWIIFLHRFSDSMFMEFYGVSTKWTLDFLGVVQHWERRISHRWARHSRVLRSQGQREEATISQWSADDGTFFARPRTESRSYPWYVLQTNNAKKINWQLLKLIMIIELCNNHLLGYVLLKYYTLIEK